MEGQQSPKLSLFRVRTPADMSRGKDMNFDVVALPMIRSMMPKIDVSQLIGVQPMQPPAGQVFFMDFKFGPPPSKQSLMIRAYRQMVTANG